MSPQRDRESCLGDTVFPNARLIRILEDTVYPMVDIVPFVVGVGPPAREAQIGASRAGGGGDEREARL
jgi:hypothetical protein